MSGKELCSARFHVRIGILEVGIQDMLTKDNKQSDLQAEGPQIRTRPHRVCGLNLVKHSSIGMLSVKSNGYCHVHASSTVTSSWRLSEPDGVHLSYEFALPPLCKIPDMHTPRTPNSIVSDLITGVNHDSSYPLVRSNEAAHDIHLYRKHLKQRDASTTPRSYHPSSCLSCRISPTSHTR